MEESKLRLTTIEQKYKEWSKVLLEPTTVNDARLFAVEARIE